MIRKRPSAGSACIAWVVVGMGLSLPALASDSREVLDQIGVRRGIVALVGDARCGLAIDLARASELMIYVQLPEPGEVSAARQAADEAGLYGNRIVVDGGSPERLYLGDNLADAVVALGDSASKVPEAEALRVLCPGGKALLGGKTLIKPAPSGLDDWSHPYHGPDNNPQSTDRVIVAPYLTQFLAYPQYGPAPQVAVASAGRVFKAFGHVAWHKREEAFLNKLVAFNGYNGTILWTRDLADGVMIHRNTMIATPDTLYLGDDTSCKLIDTATGKVRDEIAPPAEVAGGTFWKWIALEEGVLYAVIGEQELRDKVERWGRTEHGWPWDAISTGYNQPQQPWGYGRTALAIDVKTKQVKWHHREDDQIDGRAVCMKSGRLFLFQFGSHLTCLNTKDGSVHWRKTPANAPELFKALGEYNPRQGWQTNWRTTAYLKCSDKALYFAGPQLNKLLAVSTDDGHVLWEDPYDNYQLILRPEGLFGISGPWGINRSRLFDPLTGEVLAELALGRRACTRPTASVDAIFYRAEDGSVRFDVADRAARWVSPMRPPCHDGVTIANGHLYWWPYACDCQLQIHGVIGLGPAGNFDFAPKATDADRLQVGERDTSSIAELPESPADWPTFRANSTATVTSGADVPAAADQLWEAPARRTGALRLTAPVAAGGLVLLGDGDGAVRALDAATGKPRWTVYTGGPIRIPPTIWKGRAYVGSGDGWVYCLEAKTGRQLWRFRAAPVERKVPVYGTLSSTWPVGGGVIVEDGVAYVAAGIVNYDGTHLYALDAATGAIRWQNSTSGHLDPKAKTGVSVQGHMILNDGKLYLAGGNAVSPAVYDVKNGHCLNDAEGLDRCESSSPRGWELFLLGNQVIACGKPFYVDPDVPVYDHTVFEKMLHASNGRRDILWQDNSKLMCYEPISSEALNACVEQKRSADYKIHHWGQLKLEDKPLWAAECPESVAVALCRNAVVVARRAEVIAFDVESGQPRWSKPLPAPPVAWGLAVDAAGRVVLTLEDGRIVCFG